MQWWFNEFEYIGLCHIFGDSFHAIPVCIDYFIIQSIKSNQSNQSKQSKAKQSIQNANKKNWTTKKNINILTI